MRLSFFSCMNGIQKIKYQLSILSHVAIFKPLSRVRKSLNHETKRLRIFSHRLSINTNPCRSRERKFKLETSVSLVSCSPAGEVPLLSVPLPSRLYSLRREPGVFTSRSMPSCKRRIDQRLTSNLLCLCRKKISIRKNVTSARGVLSFNKVRNVRLLRTNHVCTTRFARPFIDCKR